jgi:hypothetical protein
MPMLLFGRIVLLAYIVGLILVIIQNFFGGRVNFHKPKSDRLMTFLVILMFVKGFIIYLSIIAMGYWAVMAFGWFWGILSALGALIFQFQIGFFIWRRF